MIQPILSKQARLHLEFSEEPLTVLVDQTQLRQVLMNLVTNASDALPEGEGDITISTQRRQLDASELEGILLHEHLAPGEFVCVSVEDNGAGIEADRLARIFDPFYTTKHSGRGLGLASVLGLVRRHSGGLKVESEPGKGTRFEVLLPYSPQTVERNKGEALSRKASRPGTVLLVDDEEVVRSVAKQILEYAQFDVLVASSGLEALELFAARSACIDVVLLDVSMPDLDGREVYSRLRATDPKARIVLTSGYTEQELLADFSSEGLAGFLQKPYSPEKLIELLEQL